MKRILRLIIAFVMLMPIFLYASTYSDSRTRAKRFVQRDYSDTYQRYLIDAGRVGTLPWSNNSNDNESYTNGDIAFGGMLTKIEYENSRGDAPRSYLFDGKQYWSMTSEGEGHYVIGLNSGLSDSNNTPATKVTEYVLSDTKVTGKGTIDKPWVFVPKYSLTVTGENGKVNPVGKGEGEAVVVNGVNDSVTFELTPDSGNNYLYNTCGLITSPETSKEINDSKKITFRGINKDISCKIVFGKGLFELKINQVNKTTPIEEQEEIRTTPSTLYVRNSEQFYSDSAGNYPVTKLNPFVVNKRGYTLEGFYYDMPGGGKIKVIDTNGNIDRIAAKNITTNGELKPSYTAKVVRTTLNGNGGKFSNNSNTMTVDLTYGKPYGTFAEPVKEGYTLSGWYDAASGGNKIDLTKNFYEVSDHPLFARWEAAKYLLTYNATGGTVTPTSKTVTYDSTYGTLATPVKGGFKFAGWFTAETGGTQVTSTTTVKTSSNHSVYAHWTTCTNNIAGVKEWNTGTECSIKSCNTGYRLSSNQCLQNKVTIKYKLGSGETISGGSAYNVNADRFITKSGNVFTTTANYGQSIGTSGLADYNNTSYINILKSGYKAVSGSEWLNVSDSSKKYSQSTNYNANDFCNAGTNNCEVSLQVNWTACTNNSRVATWKANNNCEINTCQAGYKVSSNTCVACGVAHATAYSSGCTPSACETGYVLNNNKCEETPKDNYTYISTHFKCSDKSAGTSYVFEYGGCCDIFDDGNDNYRVKLYGNCSSRSGQLTIKFNQKMNIDLFLVGGGGASGKTWGGGGGGGYTNTFYNLTFPAGTYTTNVGAGGSSGCSTSNTHVCTNGAAGAGGTTWFGSTSYSAAGGTGGNCGGAGTNGNAFGSGHGTCYTYNGGQDTVYGGSGGSAGGAGWSDWYCANNNRLSSGGVYKGTTNGGSKNSIATGQGHSTCEFAANNSTASCSSSLMYSAGGNGGCCVDYRNCSGGAEGGNNTGNGGSAWSYANNEYFTYHAEVYAGGSGVIVFRNKR